MPGSRGEATVTWTRVIVTQSSQKVGVKLMGFADGVVIGGDG